jgi:uncharacterized protein YlxP (DUF503 family)
MSDPDFHVTLLTIELLIPHAHSLKEKRSAVRGLRDRIRSRFNASVAEVGYQDKWQHALLAACLVGSDRRQLASDADRLRGLCEEAGDVEIAAIDQQWL